jgi:hypothetical protein
MNIWEKQNADIAWKVWVVNRNHGRHIVFFVVGDVRNKDVKLHKIKIYEKLLNS